MIYAYVAFVILRKCQWLIGLNTMSDDYRLGELQQQFGDVVGKVNVEQEMNFLSIFSIHFPYSLVNERAFMCM